MRRPLIAVGALGGAAGRPCAAGHSNLHTKQSSFTDLPKSLSIVKTYDTIQASFPGSQDPAHLVVRADDVTTPQFAKAYRRVQETRASRPGVIQQPIRVAVNNSEDGRAGSTSRSPARAATQRAVRALATLRTEVIPPVLATLPVENRAGRYRCDRGQCRLQQDDEVARADRVRVRARASRSCCCSLTFRSIVIPIKAIIAQPALRRRRLRRARLDLPVRPPARSCSASTPTAAIVTWLPLFLFTVLFGLSMDYHVFILSRVKELVDQRRPDRPRRSNAASARPHRRSRAPPP